MLILNKTFNLLTLSKYFSSKLPVEQFPMLNICEWYYSRKYTVTLHALSGDKEAARKHAQWYVSDVRRWVHYALYSGLSDSRSNEEKTELVEQLFRKYENRVAEAPEKHALRAVCANSRVRKI